MKTDELALDYIDRAELTLEEARRYLAIEYPRDHDVSDVLVKMKETRKVPAWFYEKIDFMSGVSSDLARKRGPAFYGIERSVTPASKIFGRDEGLKALRGAEEILKLCRRLIKEGIKG